MTPADMLEAGAAWLEMPGHEWGKGWCAVNATGNYVNPRSEEAERWCGMGAMYAACPDVELGGADAATMDRAFAAHHNKLLGVLNDSVRTKAEVIAAMREAAAAWRAQNQGAP